MPASCAYRTADSARSHTTIPARLKTVAIGFAPPTALLAAAYICLQHAYTIRAMLHVNRRDRHSEPSRRHHVTRIRGEKKRLLRDRRTRAHHRSTPLARAASLAALASSWSMKPFYTRRRPA